MTTTGEFTPPQATAQRPRVLRRSRTDRVGAGVAGGLGAYFNVDPVLFRVLFATSAFFGGAGVLAYLLAWAAIPEEGTQHAAIDRWVHEMRRRRIPLWIVAVAAGLLLWAIAFSWWAPGPFFPVMIAVIILVLIFARRGPSEPAAPPYPPATQPYAGATPYPPATPTAAAPGDATAPVSLEKDATAAQPGWVGESRDWFAEARAASRERRRRAFPVRITAVVALVLTLGTLGIIDAATGIAFPVYFWVTFGITALALLVGVVLRRTPWSLTALLIPAVIGTVAFGGTHASLHDGVGQRDWTPTTSLSSEYKLAFGQGVLDLTHLSPLTSARTVDVTVAGGQVRVLLPHTMNATVKANVHFGQIVVDGQDYFHGHWRHNDGINVERTILPPSNATGTPLTVNVHLADGQISVEHTG